MRLFFSCVLQMLKRLQKNLFDVRIVERVEDGFPAFASFDHAHVAQISELVGHGGLAHVQQGGQIVHAQLPMKQGADQLDSRRIPKSLEQLGQTVGGVFGDHELFDFLQRKIGMCAAFFRPYQRDFIHVNLPCG